VHPGSRLSSIFSVHPAGLTRSINQSLARAEELGMRPLQAHGHHGFGNSYATTGQREPARAELSATTALDSVMEIMFWVPWAETALAEVEAC
jgi:hypothetical protein